MSDLPETELKNQTKENVLGIQLSKARENQGLTIKDIADRLHLSESVIEAIEKDDYDHLPAPAFVRGYLRKYAALVNLDTDSVIEKYNQHSGEMEGMPDGKDNLFKVVGRKSIGNSNNVKIEAYLALVLAVVIGIAYLAGPESTSTGYEGDRETEKDQASDKAFNDSNKVSKNDQEINSAVDSKISYYESGRVYGDSGLLQDQQVVDDNTETPVQPMKATNPADFNDSDSAGNIDTVDLGNKPGQNSDFADTNIVQPLAKKFDALQEDKDSSSTETLVLDEPQLADTGKLSLKFHSDAWIEVHDANGDRLLYRMGREGRTYQITGKAPFKVLLGNAREVTVMLNGQVFNQMPYIRGQVARFMAGTTANIE